MSAFGWPFRPLIMIGAVLLVVLAVLSALVQVEVVGGTSGDRSGLERNAQRMVDEAEAFSHAYTSALLLLTRATAELTGNQVTAQDVAALANLLVDSPALRTVAWLSPTGETLHSRGPSADRLLQHLDLVALPTDYPAISEPYSPAEGALALTVTVPVHPRPGPVLAYLVAEVDLTACWRRLNTIAQADRLMLTLSDRQGRRIFGGVVPRELAAQSSSLAQVAGREVYVTETGGHTALAIPLHQPRWCVLVRPLDAQGLAALSPLLVGTLLAGGMVLLLGALRRTR